MRKKIKGNMLIESIVGLMILGIALLIAMTSTISVSKSNNKRASYNEVNRVCYSIMNEVKYNYSYDQIKNEIDRLKSGNYISFKYSRDILEKLTTIELLNLERSNDIIVKVLSVDDVNKIVEMEVSITVQINGEVISSERKFNKSQWMHL